MRLEHDDQTLAVKGFRSLQRGRDLGGMVTVIIHNKDPARIAFTLKAPLDVLKCL